MHRENYVFGNVSVECYAQKDRAECRVRLKYQDVYFLDTVISKNAPYSPFSLRNEADLQIIVSGELRFHTFGEQWSVLLDMKYPGGIIEDFTLIVGSGPEPPYPPSPDPEPIEADDLLIETCGIHHLFPYIYLRPWPKASPQELIDRFLQYTASEESQTQTSLYERLASLAKAKERKLMEETAVTFLNDQDPFIGQVIRNVRKLPPPMNSFAEIDLLMRCRPETDLDGFIQLVCEISGSEWIEIANYVLHSEVFPEQLDRLWQNIFAYAVILNYDCDVFENIIATLETAALLQRILASPESFTNPELWTPSKIHQAICATAVLPEEIFPLPPSQTSVRKASEGTILPYAIGDLEIVKRKLIGYRLGEVSHIENIMKGEYLEKTRRQNEQSGEQWRSGEALTTDGAQTLQGEQRDLGHQIQKALSLVFELDAQTQYGPPAEGTQKSQWKMAPNATTGTTGANSEAGSTPNASTMEKAAEFARQITSQAVTRLSQRIFSERETYTRRESEQIEVHRIDGSGFQQNVRGVYRWVNEVYEAWVANYGQRLVLEAILPQPAKAYLSTQQALHGWNLSTPPTLEQCGISSFSDVEAYDTSSSKYYGKLAAAFQTGPLLAPPPQTQVTSTVLQLGTGVHSQSIAVPAGYRATSFTVTAAWSSQASKAEIFGITGSAAFHLVATDSVPATGLLSKESATVPITVSLTVSEESTALTTPQEKSPLALTTIEVSSTIDDQRLNEWKAQTYQLLFQAQERNYAAYRTATGAGRESAPIVRPGQSRALVRECLRRQLTLQLINRVVQLTEENKDVFLGGAFYSRFLENALEWKEMAYSFLPSAEDTPLIAYEEEDLEFSTFLQAGYVRILLPVEPAYAEIMLYFLASGMVWIGQDCFTPANTESVDLINNLKDLSRNPLKTEIESRPWRITIPTAMTVLQKDDTLPSFEREKEDVAHE